MALAMHMHMYHISPYILLASLGHILLDVNSQWHVRDIPESG